MISASALGMEAGDLNGQPPDQERLARAALLAFQAKLSNLASWLPKGSIGKDGPYVPTGLRVFVRSGSADRSGLKQPFIEWPLHIPLAEFGAPLTTGPGLRCGAVVGADLAKLLSLARSANQLSRWRSADETYSLTFRPLLPDESGCPR